VPAGNWNPTLPIDAGTGFVQWPAGPLFPSDGETMLRVEAWVMQNTTGAVQMTFQTNFLPHPRTWIADTVWYPKNAPGSNPPWTRGLFQPGPALGTAIAIATQGNVQSYYWWTQEVELIP
jgi:hypothetical protein